jgi:hypothetical protein
MDYETQKRIYDHLSYRKYGVYIGRSSSCDHEWGLIFPDGDDRAQQGCTRCGIPVPDYDEVLDFIADNVKV